MSLRKIGSKSAFIYLRNESSLPLPPVGSIRDVGWRGGLWTGRPVALSGSAGSGAYAKVRVEGAEARDVAAPFFQRRAQ